MKDKTPVILLVIYILVFIICGISPYDRSVWWAENIPIIAIVISAVLISKYFKFSAVSYLMMSVLVILHTIGGHYTFERVPFGFITDLFGFERNHYDRMAHFTVGFYAYPIAEALLKRKLVNTKWILYFFPVFTILSVAAVYELFEWIFAITSDPTAGIAVLGSQGDIWDAQKDMLADGLGGIFAVLIFYFMNRKEINETMKSLENR
jgi:putative membrane protein